jgi:hypothetical protein
MTGARIGQSEQADSEEKSVPRRMAEGFAVDVLFGFVLLIVFKATESFSVAFFVTMGGCVAAWLGWHYLKHRLRSNHSDGTTVD